MKNDLAVPDFKLFRHSWSRVAQNRVDTSVNLHLTALDHLVDLHGEVLFATCRAVGGATDGSVELDELEVLVGLRWHLVLHHHVVSTRISRLTTHHHSSLLLHGITRLWHLLLVLRLLELLLLILGLLLLLIHLLLLHLRRGLLVLLLLRRSGLLRSGGRSLLLLRGRRISTEVVSHETDVDFGVGLALLKEAPDILDNTL